MSEASDNFSRLLPALKARYHKILAEKILEISRLLAALRLGVSIDSDLYELALLVHGLKGSGSTLGAFEVTRIASELEIILPDPMIKNKIQGPANINLVLPLLEEFKTACEDELESE